MRSWPDTTQPHPLVSPSAVPDYLRPLIDRTLADPVPTRLEQLSGRRGGTASPARESAVLMLFADDGDGPDLLLTRRASTLRNHAGQPAFPGGALDPGEDAVQAALREGQEETGLLPTSVRPLLLLPRLHLPVSAYAVTPVVAHWDEPGPVGPVDVAETAAVARVPVADLADPANRIQLRHPSGYTGPAFEVADMRVWGFTAALIDVLLDLAGWALPWNPDRVVEIEPAEVTAPSRARPSSPGSRR